MSKVLEQAGALLNEKVVQISLVGAILFYIVASPALFDAVRKLLTKVLGMVGVKMELDGMKLVLFHSVVFGALLYVSIKYLMGPVVNLFKK